MLSWKTLKQHATWFTISLFSVGPVCHVSVVCVLDVCVVGGNQTNMSPVECCFLVVLLVVVSVVCVVELMYVDVSFEFKRVTGLTTSLSNSL